MIFVCCWKLIDHLKVVICVAIEKNFQRASRVNFFNRKARFSKFFRKKHPETIAFFLFANKEMDNMWHKLKENVVISLSEENA